MKIISTLPKNSLIVSHAMYAFDLEFETDVEIVSHSWGGVIVEVLKGGCAGFYDYDASENSFITA